MASEWFHFLATPGFNQHLSNEKHIGWLFDIGDYSTQVDGDNKRTPISQPV